VNNIATKLANKTFLFRLEGFSPHFSLEVEGWLWIGWVVSFCGFDCFLLFVIVGCDRTPSGRGSSTRISLSDSRRSENTINTHSTIPIYIEV
jgi:hypothetical protein